MSSEAKQIEEILMRLKENLDMLKPREKITFDNFDAAFGNLDVPVPGEPEFVEETPYEAPFVFLKEMVDDLMSIRLDERSAKIEKPQKIHKCLSMIPIVTISNPIAAVTNFVRHQLKEEIIFDIVEIPSKNSSEPNYTVTAKIKDKVIGECTLNRKKNAKKRAAEEALIFLNDNHEYVKLMAEHALYKNK
jgi:hypothetical protein